jgi:hypothetical protein
MGPVAGGLAESKPELTLRKAMLQAREQESYSHLSLLYLKIEPKSSKE